MNKLSAQNQKLQERCKELENKINKLQEQAKNNLKKAKQTKGTTSQLYKNKCLMALKSKKQLQGQLKGILSHQNMLHNVQMTHETVKGHKQMVNDIQQTKMQTMQHAIKQQKQIMTKVDYDKMDNLRDQMMDMKFEANYINQMMNRNYDVDLNEEDLDQDFAEFQKEVAKEKKKNIQQQQIKVPKQQQNAQNINQQKHNLYDDNFDINKF